MAFHFGLARSSIITHKAISIVNWYYSWGFVLMTKSNWPIASRPWPFRAFYGVLARSLIPCSLADQCPQANDQCPLALKRSMDHIWPFCRNGKQNKSAENGRGYDNDNNPFLSHILSPALTVRTIIFLWMILLKYESIDYKVWDIRIGYRRLRGNKIGYCKSGNFHACNFSRVSDFWHFCLFLIRVFQPSYIDLHTK